MHPLSHSLCKPEYSLPDFLQQHSLIKMRLVSMTQKNWTSFQKLSINQIRQFIASYTNFILQTKKSLVFFFPSLMRHGRGRCPHRWEKNKFHSSPYMHISIFFFQFFSSIFFFFPSKKYNNRLRRENPMYCPCVSIPPNSFILFNFI